MARRVLFAVLMVPAGPAVFAQVVTSDSVAALKAADTPAVRTLPRIVPQQKVRIQKPKPITREISFGFRMQTDGWSLFAERGVIKTDEGGERANMFYNVRLLNAEFAEHKDAKEYKTSTSSDPNGTSKTRPIIFGKINNFYALKLGLGYRRLIAGKPEPNTVSIHWVYNGGLSLGLLKPYYISAFVPDPNSGSVREQTIKYTDKTAPYFLDAQNNSIIGGASFMNGLGEIQLVPGVHARTGLHFDFAAGKKGKLAVETGLTGELYTKAIQLMAGQKAASYFAGLYASFQVGKRYAGKQ